MKTPESERTHYRNSEGLKGWIFGRPFSLERCLYTLHRATGLGMLLYLLLHIGVTWFKNYPDTWFRLMGVLSHPFFVAGEMVVFLGIAFHGINGIRLIAGEFGLMLGKPGLPVYPYSTSLLRQRPLAIVLMVLTAVIVGLGFLDAFVLH